MIKYVATFCVLIFALRLITFNFNPQLSNQITITTYTVYNEDFYTSSTNNINFSFESKENIEIGSIISYESAKFDEKYNSYNLAEVRVIEHKTNLQITILKFLKTKKQEFLVNLKTLFSPIAYQLASGTLLGEKSALDKNFKQDLITTGLIHVVVVSGFNISLVGLIIIESLKRFGQKFALTGGLVAIALYAIFVGLEPPVLRAVIMGAIVIWARLKGKEATNIYTLILVALILVFINPLILTSISFQLSFLATLGILTFTPIFDTFIPRLLSDLSASVAAQILVLPIIAYNFEQISVISPITNLLTLWTIPLITIFSGLILIMFYVAKPLAFVLVFLVEMPSKYVEFVVTKLANLNFASVNVSIGVTQVILLYLLIVLFYLALTLINSQEQ